MATGAGLVTGGASQSLVQAETGSAKGSDGRFGVFYSIAIV